MPQLLRTPFAALVGSATAAVVRRDGGPIVLMLALAAADSDPVSLAAAALSGFGVILAPKGKSWPPPDGSSRAHAAVMAAAATLLALSAWERSN